MTFQQLQYLLEIHRAGTISQAAKNLFVSQPSVSICLSTLEEELGFSIFTRNQKGLIPTPEGSRAIAYAKQICSSHEHLINIKKSMRPVFRCSGPSFRSFNRAYAQLAAECAGKAIRFSAVSQGPASMIRKLAACELDVGVLYTLSPWVHEIRRQLDERKLAHQVLASVPVAIRIGTSHPLSQKQDILPQDLKGMTLIEMPSRDISNSVYKGILPIDPENVILYTNAEMCNALVSKGLGYAVGVPLSDASCREYGIRNIPLQGYSYEVIVMTNPAQAAKPETVRFIELLKAELKDYTATE